MANSCYNDKKKLADAIALARSFSKAKPAKGKARPRAHSQGQGRQLRGATRQQLTQSIVRTYLNPLALIQTLLHYFKDPEPSIKRAQEATDSQLSSFRPAGKTRFQWLHGKHKRVAHRSLVAGDLIS